MTYVEKIKQRDGMTTTNGDTMKLTKINLGVNNRMLRVGFGKHDGKWFFRVDLWFVGWRLS